MTPNELAIYIKEAERINYELYLAGPNPDPAKWANAMYAIGNYISLFATAYNNLNPPKLGNSLYPIQDPIPDIILPEPMIKLNPKQAVAAICNATPLRFKSIEYDLTSDKWQSNSDGTVEYNNSIWVNKPLANLNLDLVFDVYADVAGDVPADTVDSIAINNAGKPVYTIVIAEGDIRSELGNIISLGGLSKDLSWFDWMYSEPGITPDAVYTGNMPYVVIDRWGGIILAQEEVV
jgi:hypothetical protein